MLTVLVGQIGLGAAIAAVLWGMFGSVHGYSALLGCLISVIPNAFLALRLSLPRREKGAKALIQAAYIGELGKWALTMLLFGVVFVMVRPLVVAALFATFIVTALVPLIGLLSRDEIEEQETVISDGE
ncbi:MAG: ATP synthase subunit I [Gammaproteobacteria bacterium]|nr:ATP synthase subunit I [Gammaproteobacteria bacterium]